SEIRDIAIGPRRIRAAADPPVDVGTVPGSSATASGTRVERAGVPILGGVGDGEVCISKQGQKEQRLKGRESQFFHRWRSDPFFSRFAVEVQWINWQFCWRKWQPLRH